MSRKGLNHDRKARERWEKKQERKQERKVDVSADAGNVWVEANSGGIGYYTIAYDMMRGISSVSPNQPTPPAEPPVEWEDIIGLEDAKTALREAIEAPHLHAQVYKHFNIKPPKGVLLYGPPGCGKTMLGKAAAAAMAKVHKKSAMDGFFYFNGAEMMGPYVGDEGKWVRQCFAKADEFSQRNGYPAVLFFDECDSMLPDRRSSPRWVVEGVNTFLALMDGMKPCNAFIILATNDHKTLDEAAIRAGRIDKKIYVGRPERAAVSAILKSGLSKKPIALGFDSDSLADFALTQLFAESRVVGDKELHQFLNGATAVNVVERAALLAFKKAIQAGLSDVAGLGIGVDEIRESVDAIHQETKALKEEESRGGGRVVKAEAHITMTTEADGGEMDEP